MPAPTEVRRRGRAPVDVDWGAWRELFEDNARRLLTIPWADGVELTAAERRAIVPSIQEFQLGEGSDGSWLIRFAEARGEPGYAAAVALFVAEEQRHSGDLARFLGLAGEPLLERSWTDSVFRALRRVSGLEVSVAVLLTAELIAMVYYAALREATGSAVLERLCTQVLRDEKSHVAFQCLRLASLRTGRAPAGRALTRLAHRVLFLGTCLVIWPRHGPVFRRAGLSIGQFLGAARAELGRALALMEPGFRP